MLCKRDAETQNNSIRDRLGKIEGHLEARSQERPHNALLITLLSILGVAVVGYWGWIGTQVVKQGNQITQILATIIPQTIKDASLNPRDPQSAKRVEQALQSAAKQGKQIDASVISEAGTRFVDASDNNPSAWSAALALADYNSAVNVSYRVVKTVATPVGTTFHYDTGPLIDGKPTTHLSFVPAGVAPGDAARFEEIGRNLNEALGMGTPQLIASGGAITLDNKYIRHVIFKNVEIHYSGKPLMIEDAVFFNCTFIFDNTPQCRGLGKTLLASSPVNFQQAG
jgi:hypothetical protein